MSVIVEIDEHGAIQLPHEVLAVIKPNTRNIVEIQGERVVLHPQEKLSARLLANPVERAEAVRNWAALERPTSPVLRGVMWNIVRLMSANGMIGGMLHTDDRRKIFHLFRVKRHLLLIRNGTWVSRTT